MGLQECSQTLFNIMKKLEFGDVEYHVLPNSDHKSVLKELSRDDCPGMSSLLQTITG
jgi:hypothetical protein